MKTKPIFLFVALTLATTLFASDTQVDGIWYDFDNTNLTASVTYKGNSFYENEYTGSVVIPASISYDGKTYSVTTIEYYAFRDCSGLTSVTIPNSVTTIGESAFYSCSGLTSPVYNANCFAYLPRSHQGTYSIPNGIKQIVGAAFSGCSGLTSITIPNSVTTIGREAFSGCIGLKSIAIPNSVTTIGYNAFYGCSRLPVIDNIRYADTYLIEAVDKSLSTYTIREGTKWIGSNAFEYCTGLTSVTIPNSVTTIGSYAFGFCSGLTSVTIGNSVTVIEDHTFFYCTGLTSVTIPNSVTTIRNGAFEGCSGLTSPVYNANCFAYMPPSYMGAYTIPDGIQQIAGDAFYKCTGLTSVTIPNSVTTIGYYAFFGCTGLMSINVDAANTHYCSADGVLFNYAKDTLIQYPIGNSRTEYIIPNSVTTIGDYAFQHCSGLTSITCYATNPPTCGSYCFNGVNKTIPVYVPARSVDAYKQADGWKDFANIQSIDQGQCGTNLYWQYSDGILGISGTGAMYDYTQGTAPWMLFFQDSISSLVINNGCTSIGNFAFYGLSNKNFKTIDIPNGVEQIGQFAFANCEYIKNVYLGLSLEKISANAFANDERLLYITCFAIEPPLLDESAFVNYDAYLSVPCESQNEYKVAKGWKLFNKENVSCIGAEEKPVTGDEVTVAPSADNATFTWPQNDQAAGYSIEITKDGIVFCTLTFNAQGQLTGIAFAPNRAGSRMLDAAVMTSNGWQFTVTGLDQACKYGYALDALNASKQSIKHYEGEFATDGYTSLEWVTSDHIQGINKMLLDGHLYILRDGNLHTATGARVK
ncbi:MAG: leucine-rich repeat domain-containing protein [Bacteroidales bacterium]|nr:leucine-rich repeat domain-containing protein [Candidatus Colicola equi]